MTSESKILTVSYGTFSCTLEGFENPFDTMKAIAEYFRDLAAQDRHFGAEPPPPDAAMLHRLAEREVARLSGAALRDTAPKAEALADGPPAEPAVSPRIQFNVAPERRRGRLTQEGGTPFGEDAAAEPSLKEEIPEGVAAKLARIRRSVHPAAAELADAPSEALADDITDAAQPFRASPAETHEPFARSAASETGPEPTVQAFEPLESSLAEAAEHDIPDVATRLGALVADGTEADRPIRSFADAYDRFGDTDLDGEPQTEAAVDPADIADLVALDAATPAEAVPEATTFAAMAEDPLPEELEQVAGIAPADPFALATEDPLPEDAPTLGGVQPDADFAVTRPHAADPVPAGADGMDRPDDSPALLTEAPAEIVAEAAAIEPGPDARAARRSRRLSSRVVLLHPDEDGSAADASDTRPQARESESDEIARLMQQAEKVMGEETNKRRQEALSRLKAAVASTEADRADLDYEAPRGDANLDPYRDDLAEAIQPDAPEAPPAPSEVKPTRRKSVNIRPQEPRPGTIRPGMISPPPLVLVSEQRIDRVAPAVAPAPAAPAPSLAPAVPGIAPAGPAGQPMVALRTGRLSGAIGAGAAVAASAAPARGIVLEKPSYGTPAEAAEDEDLAEDNAEIDEAGLSAFAQSVGARSMAELLEAAAAYATCVEKRPQFTRPQLMRRMVASAGGKPVSREDGLRSFGTLLRTGRIEKVTRGHYSLTESSPYLAEARRLS